MTVKKTRPHAVFTVTKLEDITNVIIPHFSQYHLLTKKVIDFNLFKSAVKIMNHKGHLEKEGLNQIVSIKYSMNRGLLSDKLKESFPNVEPFIGAPIECCSAIPHPMWISGFVTGEGCFNISIDGNYFIASFYITQKDFHLLTTIRDYLGCGNVYLKRLL